MSWNNRRSRNIRKTITFSHDEWEQARHLHRLVNGNPRFKSYGNFAREMLITGAVRPILVQPLTDSRPIAREIGRIGVNINQIAHWANENKNISPTEVLKIKQSQANIEKLLGKLLDDEHEARTRAGVL